MSPLEAARLLASARDADEVLRALAQAVHDLLGMTVAVNVRRPEDDRFEVVMVIGGGDASQALVGQQYEMHNFVAVHSPRYLRPDGLYLIPASAPEWQTFEGPYVVEQQRVMSGIDAWLPHDLLDIPLRDRHGEILAVIAADDPRDGRSPSDDRLSMVAVLAQHAASALEARLATRDAEDGQREAEELQHLSTALAAGLDEAEILERAAEGVCLACRFAFAVIALYDDSDRSIMRVVAAAGDGRRQVGTRFPAGVVESALAGATRISDSFLATPETAVELVGLEFHRSVLNGTGAKAWKRHVLLVPLATGAGETLGMMAIDDPLDRLLPPVESVRRIELFARQAALLVSSTRALAQARDQATRDPLTGLENARAFEASLADAVPGACAVALIDVDRFKLVNDRIGHLRGDAVLRDLATALGRGLPRRARAFRIGGDEFAVLAEETTGDELERWIEHVRASLLTASVAFSSGIAETPADAHTPAALVHAADTALYAAKRAGRGRTERYQARGDAAPRPDALTGAVQTVARGSVEAPEILDALLDGLMSALGARAAAYYEHDFGRRAIVVRVLRSGSASSLEVGAIRPFSAVPRRRVLAETAQPIILYRGEQGLDEGEDRYLEEQGCGSCALIPVIVKGVAVGHLELGFSGDAPLSYGDLSHAIAVADIAGLALARERQALEVENAYRDTVGALATALETKDAVTGDHARALESLAAAVARRLGLEAETVRRVEYTALFHDIGKIATPTELLRKPAALTPDERKIIEEHVAAGARIVEEIGFLRHIAPCVRHSHERWDGGGYPARLAGEQIPLESRIVFACDTWHAMTSDRPYRKALPREVAIAELERISGSQLDPRVVSALLEELGGVLDLAA
jgi:diguanylate cyclase (GGDEF)-like protein/putative nucleotidyltransferase with HDIG domain